MRNIIKIKGGKLKFQVSDDPQGLIAQFLAVALTDMDYMPQEIAEMLLPDSEGYYLNGNLCAYRIDDEKDLPINYAHLAKEQNAAEENNNIWVIFCEKKIQPYPSIAIYGQELYSLYQKAIELVGF